MSTRLFVPGQTWARILIFQRLTVLAASLCFCSHCERLNAAAALPNYFARFWQNENGLPDNKVTSIVQTREGYLWLGTRSGLVRFDGVRFTAFDDSNTPEMKSRNVTCLFEASDNSLWIGYETGEVIRYHAGKFEQVDLRAPWRGGKIFAIGEDATKDIWLFNHFGDLIRVKDSRLLEFSSPSAFAHLVA